MEWWRGGATKNVIVTRKIFCFDFVVSEILENLAFEITVVFFKIGLGRLAFLAVAE